MTTAHDLGRIVVDRASAVIDNAWGAVDELLIDDGRLSQRIGAEVATLDARGLIVMHAFVDTHIHGIGDWRFWGHDTEDAYSTHVRGAARALPEHGVGAFMPTSITEADGGRMLIAAVADVCRGESAEPIGGARVLGCHAEGPFLNPDFIGAHTPEAVRRVSEQSVDALLGSADGAVRVITASPSIDDFEVLTAVAARHGARVQLGHDCPSPEIFASAVKAGAAGVTHLFNAMGGLHHRRDDFAAMALTTEGMYLELILNPSFVAPTWILLAIRSASSRVLGVSDCVGDLSAARAFNGTSLRPGKDGIWVRVSDGATWASTSSLADHLGMLIDAGVGWTVISRVLALNAIERFDLPLGTAPGDPANLVCIDPRGTVVATILNGRLEWLRDENRLVA